MGKAKKGKRADKDEEFDSDLEVGNSVYEETNKSKKSKDKTKAKDQVEDIADNLKELKIETSKSAKKDKKSKKRNVDSSDDEVSQPKSVDPGSGSDTEISKSKKKNKKNQAVKKDSNTFNVEPDSGESDSEKTKSKSKKKKGAKDLLLGSDDEGESKPSKSKKKQKKKIESDNESDNEVEKPTKKGKKGKKAIQLDESDEEMSERISKPKAKKKKDADDEDIDKVLAELETEQTETKKKSAKSKKPSKAGFALLMDDGQDDDGEDEPVEKTPPPSDDESEKVSQKKPQQPKQKTKKAKKKKDESDEDIDKVLAELEMEYSGQKVPKDDSAKPQAQPDEETAKQKSEKGPNKKMIAAMQEALKIAQEEEDRLKREEEERIRLEEEREKARLEKLQREQEKKEKKKLKEKQRKEKLKQEGKLLTNKQKQAQARAQAMLEALKAQGLEMPEVGEKKPRPGTRQKPGKLKQQTSTEEKEETPKPEEIKTEQVQVEITDQKEQVEEKKDEEEDDGVKDAWDAESSEEEEEEAEDDATKTSKKVVVEESKKDAKSSGKDSTPRNHAERRKEKVRQRIQNRRIEAEKKRTVDDLRAAVVCVLGHVDTGKTKILDKLRRTNVQDGEAGGITQQIGATNVPIDAIRESTKHVKGFADKVFKIPGLLIIDTPGHESFSNLRNRGSSLCDIAILVVDIMHGLEPQTIESINLLKTKKCPFVVALNKIDRLYDWQTMNRKDVQDIIKSQGMGTQREFDKRAKEVIVQFAEQGLNAAIYYENPDPRSYVSLVPTSAITGEGMGNLLGLIVDACQGPLAKRLMFCEELQATVLEVKALPGLGTTIDCILVNGILKEGDTMIVAGTEGPIVTQIRSLLMPQPMKELRVKNAYMEHREVKAAQGVKIAAKELEKAIAGLNLVVAQKPDEVEILKEEIAKELTHALGKIKLAERGVFVQASTLGALEALLDFLKTSKIPYAGIRIGPVVKKDVMKASIMLEHDSQYATILAFDVKIERDAQELADTLGVKIFQADIIYHLFDRFIEYKEQLRQRKRDEHKHIAVFPCKLKVLPQYVFKSRDPIVMGVMVEAGIVKEGTPICVPSKE
ncbi:hypothetical protein QAD02_012317, partial [Eretmocerus hayati]